MKEQQDNTPDASGVDYVLPTIMKFIRIRPLLVTLVFAGIGSALMAQDIITLAGSGVSGFADGTGANASFAAPYGVDFDASGNLYVADINNHRIRKVTPDGVVTTIAGTGAAGFSGDGGPAINAEFREPRGLTIDDSGNIYVTDSRNHRVRKITPDGLITTIAGTGTAGTAGDNGLAINANLNLPIDVAFDATGDLFVSEEAGHVIRKIDISTNIITTFAGNGTSTYSGDGGLATNAGLPKPYGIVFDGQGNLFIAMFANDRIRKVDTQTGIVTTFAGTGTAGSTDGQGDQASFHEPLGLAVDQNNNLYVADAANHKIRKVTPDAVVTTIAGTGTDGYSGDGGPAIEASFNYPSRLTFDASGNLFITGQQSHTVREIEFNADEVRSLPLLSGYQLVSGGLLMLGIAMMILMWRFL